jgi:hypothetical protein
MGKKITDTELRIAKRTGAIVVRAIQIHDRRCFCTGMPIDDDYRDAILERRGKSSRSKPKREG